MTVICLIKYYNKHLFFIFLLSLCLKNVSSQIISNSSIAGFFTPDSVCVNSPVNITNTSVGASTYYWNFCVADITKTPLAINLGNIGGLFSMPVFTDIVSQGGNYFVFVVNNLPGKLLRLNFGNSLLNTPTITNLGNFGGALHDNAEGIQIENDQNNWYAIIVGGNPGGGVASQILRLSFGTNISNNTPTATDWGNIGNLDYPTDLDVFYENGNWYGFTLNSLNNTITLFNFGNSFTNTPSAQNLGNIGNLNFPTGIYAINDNGHWYAFITNGIQDGTITRLDFGNSLLNTPTATNLGDFGGILKEPRDIYIIKFCGSILGFVVNKVSNDIIKLDFNNNLASIPTASSLGNLGNLSFPHSISQIFRVNSDLYSFITNVNNNSITRIEFKGGNCNGILSSTAQNPPPVTYQTSGIYNINLSVDDGLPTQNTYCRQVVVVGSPIVSISKDTSVCINDSIKIFANGGSVYQWTPISRISNPNIYNPIVYPVVPTEYKVSVANTIGCITKDSMFVSIKLGPSVNAGVDTSLCLNESVQLSGSGKGIFNWMPSAGLSNATVANPIASPSATTKYFLTITDSNGCTAKDSVLVTIKPPPAIIVNSAAISICPGDSVSLNAAGGETYLWSPSAGLSNPLIANPEAYYTATTNYTVMVTGLNGCSAKDTVRITANPKPSFGINPVSTQICLGDSVAITASGGDSYQWYPPDFVSNPFSAKTIVYPRSNTDYKIVISSNQCHITDSVFSSVLVNPALVTVVTKSNDIDCDNSHANLTASGGITYHWFPASGLSNPNISNPVASPVSTTTYYVTVTNIAGCIKEDSVQVKVSSAGGLNRFLMPSAFTPNGDGLNDCFGLKNWGPVIKLDFAVYNRWGNKVFSTADPSNCWDGTSEGVPQPAGAYVYQISAQTLCGNIYRKGNLVLIR